MTDIIRPDEVHYLAWKAIGFLSEKEDRLDRFLSHAGFEPAVVQSKVVSPGFLQSVLDYMVKDEALLMSFQQEQQIRPASVMVGCVYLAAENGGHPMEGPGWQPPADWSWFC